MYFFAFYKNPVVTIDKAIPRYTTEDEKATIDTYGGDLLFPGVTFGDLYRRHRHAVLVPLQEYVLDKCFYKRAILIGDSFHKMNPLTGQGGNSAIEDAAILADLLKESLDRNHRLSNETIRAQSTHFQEERKPRTKLLLDGSHALQRLEALENRFFEFLNLIVLSKQPFFKLTPLLAATYSPSHILKYLPEPSRGGVLVRDGDVIAEPSQRSFAATALWTIPLLLVAFLSLITGLSLNMEEATTVASDSLSQYTFVFTMAINAFAIPYILASTALGWHLTTPIYFALYIYLSQPKSFYYPNPRVIDLQTAKLLTPGMLITYPVPILVVLKNTAVPGWISPVVQLGLPILVSLGQTLSQKEPPSSDISEALYGTRDMPYLSKFYNLAFLFTNTLHIIIASRVFPLADTRALTALAFSPEGVQLAWLVAATMVWCIFTIWDMRRTNVFRAPFWIGILGVFLGAVCFGPAAVLVGLWKWREGALERVRGGK